MKCPCFFRSVYIFFLLFFLVPNFSFARGQRDDGTPTLRLSILNGPSSIPVAHLMNSKNDLPYDIEFVKFSDANSSLPSLLQGKVDIAFLPPNVACKVYNESPESLVCLGVSGYGNLYIITKDANIRTLSDLRGKKLTVAGRGATPEYMLRHLLQANGLRIQDIELDFSLPNASIAPAIVSGQISYACVPEPFATVAITNSPSLRRALDIQSEFAQVHHEISNYPMTVIVARKDFAFANPKLIQKFCHDIENAITQTNRDPKGTATLVEKFEFGLSKAIVEKCIPTSHFAWKPASECRRELEMLLHIFLSESPQSIGQMPDDKFYYRSEK